MHKFYKFRRLRVLYVLPCLMIVSSCLTVLKANTRNTEDKDVEHYKSRSIMEFSDVVECIPSGVDSFPPDFMNQNQRISGGIVIHFFIIIYICAMIATVCDGYFVPSLEIITEKLHLSPDVAGATFMAMGASAPELFASIAGSFITEDDIGVGTIVGSAVFNILAISGVAGIMLWTQVLDIDWYPVARDSIVYSITVIATVFIISDNVVFWQEAIILLVIFFSYIALMHCNKRIERCTKSVTADLNSKVCCCCAQDEERHSLLSPKECIPDLKQSDVSVKVLDEHPNASTSSNEDSETNQEESILCSAPDYPWAFVWWVLMYPANVLFFLTIPPVRIRVLFPLTFLISVAWMGALSYVAVWMVTIIGYTFGVPDSVAGLTILAAGSSVPDLIATVVVAKNGMGNMAISNLVGSNTFDLSFCLGAPWFIKTLISKHGFIYVYSSAMTYTTVSLLVTLASFLLTLHLSGWRLNRTVGLIFLFLYFAFVMLACMYELNVFGDINLPVCGS